MTDWNEAMAALQAATADRPREARVALLEAIRRRVMRRYPTVVDPDAEAEWLRLAEPGEVLQAIAEAEAGSADARTVALLLRCQRAEAVRDRLAQDALVALAGAGVGTPLEGYGKAPELLYGDITRLAKLRDSWRQTSETSEAVAARAVKALAISADDAGRLLHEAWCQVKAAQGFHHPTEAHPLSIPRGGAPQGTTLGTLLCGSCHLDLVNWAFLPDRQKQVSVAVALALVAELRRRAGLAGPEAGREAETRTGAPDLPVHHESLGQAGGWVAPDHPLHPDAPTRRA